MDKRILCLLVLCFLMPLSCSDNSRVEGDKAGSKTEIQVSAQQIAPLAREDEIRKSPRSPRLVKEQSTAAKQADAGNYLLAPNAGAPVLHELAQSASRGMPYLPPRSRQPGAGSRESYDAIEENRFINALYDPLSTFSIDVDTASYANVRRFINGGSLPPKGAVRTEEMINYFTYALPEPNNNEPFSLQVEVGPSPFNQAYKLVKIGLKAKDQAQEKLPPSNLVFLIDVSGSMNQTNKLPLLKQSLKLLARKLNSRDRVAIVVYAGADHIVLQATPGNETETIISAVDNLHSGGSTHASSGIITAYELAARSYMPNGNNRVILVSDGDFNVGLTSRSELQELIEEKRRSGVYLTVLGFGNGNYHDDTMEILADKGNGNYAYIDSLLEAKKVLIKERSGTLFALANDVKIQVEFNPSRVGAYRLIGYENRALADEDFRDDTKDAGEIGLGHNVTALYEVIPAGSPDIPRIDELKYQRPAAGKVTAKSDLLTVKLRYKPIGSEQSTQIARSAKDSDRNLDQTSSDFRFAASVAGFAMLLKQSDHLGSFNWDDCLTLARQTKGTDEHGYRAEFTRLVEMAQLLREQS